MTWSFHETIELSVVPERSAFGSETSGYQRLQRGRKAVSLGAGNERAGYQRAFLNCGRTRMNLRWTAGGSRRKLETLSGSQLASSIGCIVKTIERRRV
jgi:hypothetical protein